MSSHSSFSSPAAIPNSVDLNQFANIQRTEPMCESRHFSEVSSDVSPVNVVSPPSTSTPHVPDSLPCTISMPPVNYSHASLPPSDNNDVVKSTSHAHCNDILRGADHSDAQSSQEMHNHAEINSLVTVQSHVVPPLDCTDTNMVDQRPNADNILEYNETPVFKGDVASSLPSLNALGNSGAPESIDEGDNRHPHDVNVSEEILPDTVVNMSSETCDLQNNEDGIELNDRIMTPALHEEVVQQPEIEEIPNDNMVIEEPVRSIDDKHSVIIDNMDTQQPTCTDSSGLRIDHIHEVTPTDRPPPSCEDDALSTVHPIASIPLIQKASNVYVEGYLESTPIPCLLNTGASITIINSLASVDSVFHRWRRKLLKDADMQNCRHSSLLEYSSHFTVMNNRAIASILRLNEIQEMVSQVTHI